MAMISGGNVIPPGTLVGGIQGPNAEPDTKFRVAWIENAVPTDANVGGGYRTPANGELACNVTTGNMYERQAGVWTRIDTL